MQIRSVGIDLGKTTFHLVALGDNGKVLLKKKFTQKQLIAFTANMQTCLIGMEACSGSHFLGRALRAQGHDVKLIPAQFVRPFVKSNKNDFIDAEEIAEAVDRENMRFVPIKTDDQLDLQALHRVRDRLMARRTALINQIRAFLLERGIVFAKSPIRLREALPEVLENVNENLTPKMRNLGLPCCGASGRTWSFRWCRGTTKWNGSLRAMLRVGDCGRSLASDRWLQLRSWPPSVTAQPSARDESSRPGWGCCRSSIRTGGKARLYGISKRGNSYLRKILIHGARAVVLRSKPDRIANGASDDAATRLIGRGSRS